MLMSLLFQNKNYKLATHANPFGWYKQYVIEERKLRGLHACTKNNTYRNMTNFISEKDDMVYLGLHYHSFETMLYRKLKNIVSHTKFKTCTSNKFIPSRLNQWTLPFYHLACGRLLISASSAFLLLRIYMIETIATTMTTTKTRHTTITVIESDDSATSDWTPALDVV